LTVKIWPIRCSNFVVLISKQYQNEEFTYKGI